jgi:hypothetical protein
MVYEVVLTNQADLQTFALEVDTPIGWSYVLTDDAGNTAELQLEVKHHKYEIKAEITGMKYIDPAARARENHCD